MDEIWLDSKYIFPIVIGTSIFFTDYLYGWLTLILGPIPMIFVLAFIVGILAGNVEDATIDIIVSLVIGVGICAVFTPFVLEVGAYEALTIPDLLFQAVIYSTRGPFLFFTNVVVIGDAIFWVLLFTPFQYFFAPGFAGIGGRIREIHRNEEEEDPLEKMLLSSKFPKNVQRKSSDEPEHQEIELDNISTN